MIVSKKMADEYILKRPCYMIGYGKDGDFLLISTSVHWEEGMEIFLTQEECSDEIDRRREAKMNSGHCPRCNYKHATETEKDLRYLDFIQEAKGATLYECKVCKSVWYKHPSLKSAIGYDGGLKDYLIEWANRDMRPTAEMKKVLDNEGNISVEKEFELYAVNVLLKNKTEFEPALIHLSIKPPTQAEFDKGKWHYLDFVTAIEPSPLAYPKGIAKHIMKMMYNNKEWIYIKSVQTKKTYTFDAHAGVFMPQELKGQDFEIPYDRKDKENAITFYMPADRGGPDIWTMTETTAVVILGDKITG